MLKNYSLLLLYFLSLATSNLSAQEKQWTLDECMRYAIAHSPKEMQKVNKLRGIHELQQAKDQLAYETMEAFITVLYNKEVVNLAEDYNLTRRRNLLRISEIGATGRSHPDTPRSILPDNRRTVDIRRNTRWKESPETKHQYRQAEPEFLRSDRRTGSGRTGDHLFVRYIPGYGRIDFRLKPYNKTP